MILLAEEAIQVDILSTWWDNIVNAITVVLAITNVYFVYMIYAWQHKDNKESEDKQRRLQQFYNIFLSPRLDMLKDFYTKLSNIALLYDGTNEGMVNNVINKKISSFNNSFTDLLLGINQDIYNKIHDEISNLLDNLTILLLNDAKGGTPDVVNNMFKVILESNKAVMKVLFNYDGCEDGNKTNDISCKNKSKRPIIYVIIVLILIFIITSISRCSTNNSTSSSINIRLDSTQLNELREIYFQKNTDNYKYIKITDRSIDKILKENRK